MIKEMMFTIVWSLFLAVFTADPVQANYFTDLIDADLVIPENGARPMDSGLYLVFMTSLVTVLMSKMMH